MDNLESRVTDLEIQITHQIKTIEELNSVIISQQNDLKKIEKVNNFLLANFQNSHNHDDGSLLTILDSKAPNY